MSTAGISQGTSVEAAYNKAVALRESHIAIERGLRSAQSLLRCVSFFTGFLALMLSLYSVLLLTHISTLDDRAFPSILQGILPVTSLSCGLVAGALFLLYWLMGVAVDELQPGHGKQHTRRLALALLVIIACAFIFPIGMLCCIGPAWHLIGRRSVTVLSSDYQKIVALTPHITARELNKSSISRLVGAALLALFGLGLLVLAYSLF